MELLRSASAEFERAVRRLPPDSWELPTPSEISVRDLVAHVVTGNDFTALLLSGVPRDEARAAIAWDELEGEPLTAVRDSAARQEAAFGAVRPDFLVPHPHADIPASAFLRFRLVDLVVHAWDLRRGAGLDETLDPDVVGALWDLVSPHLDEMLAFGAYGEGPSGTLPPDAPLQLRLLDAFGRRP